MKKKTRKNLEICNLQADLSRQAALIRKQGQELQYSKNYQAQLQSRATAQIRSEQAKTRQEMANKEKAQNQANAARNAAEAELIQMKSVHFEAQEKIEELDAQKSKDEHEKKKLMKTIEALESELEKISKEGKLILEMISTSCKAGTKRPCIDNTMTADIILFNKQKEQINGYHNDEDDFLPSMITTDSSHASS
jgi:chromosome segregation ATPase